MATIRRYRVQWNGLPGLPGYSIFYAKAASALANDLVTFFNALKGGHPAPLVWDIPTSGDTLDDATGQINGTYTDAGGGQVAATGSGSYAAGTGFYVQWGTAAIVNGRRLRGRTFMCPLNGGSYDTAGTIASVTVTAAQAAAATLVLANEMVIWHRPLPGAGSGGSSSDVISSGVPDRVTSLRSRRT